MNEIVKNLNLNAKGWEKKRQELNQNPDFLLSNLKQMFACSDWSHRKDSADFGLLTLNLVLMYVHAKIHGDNVACNHSQEWLWVHTSLYALNFMKLDGMLGEAI